MASAPSVRGFCGTTILWKIGRWPASIGESAPLEQGCEGQLTRVREPSRHNPSRGGDLSAAEGLEPARLATCSSQPQASRCNRTSAFRSTCGSARCISTDPYRVPSSTIVCARDRDQHARHGTRQSDRAAAVARSQPGLHFHCSRRPSPRPGTSATSLTRCVARHVPISQLGW